MILYLVKKLYKFRNTFYKKKLKKARDLYALAEPCLDYFRTHPFALGSSVDRWRGLIEGLSLLKHYINALRTQTDSFSLLLESNTATFVKIYKREIEILETSNSISGVMRDIEKILGTIGKGPYKPNSFLKAYNAHFRRMFPE